MQFLTLEDFKGRHIYPKWPAFQVLLDVAEVGLKKLEEEEGMNSSIAKKSDVVRRIKIVVGGKGASEETKANPVGEIAEQEGYPKKPSEVDFELMKSAIDGVLAKSMNSAIDGVMTKSSIKKRKKPSSPLVTTLTSQTDMEDRFSDEDWISVSEKPPKKQNNNRKSSCGSGNTKGKSLNLNKTSALVQGPEPPPDLPEEFNNKINEMGGTDITLLIQKALFGTDTTKQHNRLSMPLKKIKKSDFLHEQEFHLLQQKKAIKVPLIQPSLELIDTVLGRWDMRKNNGTVSSSYILRESWTKVVNANNLNENDLVQVWSFRVEDSLCLALVKL